MINEKMFPHYHLIKKYDTIDKNLKWRKEILRKCAEDEEMAATFRQMCAEDCLFYINAMCWTFDPRHLKVPNKPFITYREFQDAAIEEGIHAIEEGYDVAWPKSRTMGASWMGLTIFEWFWHFRDSLTFLLVSRNKDYVDKTGNSKTLFWKIDYLHMNQPNWLLPTGRELGPRDPNRSLLHLKNADTKSVIDGESTTADAGRGDRRTAMFLDEFAAFEVNDGYKVLNSTRETACCRFFNSTPQGSNNAFYEVVHNTAAKVFRIDGTYGLHWSNNPRCNQGLYTSHKVRERFEVETLDKDFTGKVSTMRKSWDKRHYFEYPGNYPFINDGKLRSPWYDEQCARCASEQEIAQELDIDFLGSAYQFFDQEFIRVLIKEYCVPYLMRGRIAYESETLDPYGFELDDHGPLFLWFNLAGDGSFLTDRSYFEGKRFGLGSDVSHGTGASNSVTSVVNLVSGRKVALWKDPKTDPLSFAEETIALCKWFNNGYLAWDASGPSGRSFSNRVVEKKYHRIYYRKSEGAVRGRASDQPGYFLNPEDKAVLLRDYRSKLQDRLFINPSESGMREALEFIVEPGGRVIHSAAANSQDPTGAREAHGDEVIADALSSRLMTLKSGALAAEKPKAPWMSPAWRFEQEELATLEREREDW